MRRLGLGPAQRNCTSGSARGLKERGNSLPRDKLSYGEDGRPLKLEFLAERGACLLAEPETLHVNRAGRDPHRSSTQNRPDHLCDERRGSEQQIRPADEPSETRLVCRGNDGSAGERAADELR